ncbi:transposase [Frankia sp. Hr75.2]|nr:transposase [Frankia sp. Hr75.2]
MDGSRLYDRFVGRQVAVGAGGVCDLGYHVVWCPKYRRPVLTGPVRDRCDVLVREKRAEHGWTVGALDVMPDHVRLFVQAHPKHSPSYVANQLKGFSSHVLREEFPHVRSRLPTLWSGPYVVATVGVVSADRIRRYIDTQYERPWRRERAR